MICLPNNIFRICFIFFLLLIIYDYSYAQKTLQWQESDDADYYVIYWRSAAGAYVTENSLSVIPGDNSIREDGNIVFQLCDCNESYDGFYYSVKAANVYGNTSDFSAETEKKTNLVPCDWEPGEPGDSSIKTGAKSSDGGCFMESL